VSFTQAKTINGEGFEPFIVPKKPSEDIGTRTTKPNTMLSGWPRKPSSAKRNKNLCKKLKSPLFLHRKKLCKVLRQHPEKL
jgi:hypothetical protein